MGTIRALTFILAVTLWAVPVSAQATPGCNDTGRESDIIGGTHNSLEHDCPVVTITVDILGQSMQIQTPGSCESGGLWYQSTVYKCSGEAVGNHCVAQSFKVNTKSFSPDPICPEVPQDLKFDNISDALDAISCPSPEVVSTSFDWSANSTRCTGAMGTPMSISGTWVGEGELSRLVWEGDPADGLDFIGAAPTPIDWRDADEPMVTQVDPLLTSVVDPLGQPAAMTISASLESRRDAGGATRTAIVDGAFTSDGRFEASVREPGVDPDNRPCVIESRVAYDGTILSVMTEGSPEAMVWLPGTPQGDMAFLIEARWWASEILTWLNRPIPFDSSGIETWSSSSEPPGSLLVRRSTALVEQDLHLDLQADFELRSFESRRSGTVVERIDYDEPMVSAGGGPIRPSGWTRTVHPSSPQAFTIRMRVHRVDWMTTPTSDSFGRVAPLEERWLIAP